MDNRNRAIGSLVRLAREMRGKTQAEVAAAIDLSQPRYAQMELGRAEWSVPDVMTVSKFLGVKFERLIPQPDVKRTRRKAA